MRPGRARTPPIGQTLARSLRVLRLLDELDDLRERRVGADLRGTHPQRAVLVDRRADNRGAELLVHRQALAGHHRFVDVALTFLDHTVDRDLGPGADEKKITDDDVGSRDLERLPVAHYGRHRRREVDECTNCLVRSATRTHLEPVPEENERGQHTRRLVEHVAAAGERHDHRIHPSGTDCDRNEHHHVKSACAQGLKGALKEDRARVQDHRKAQQQRPHVVAHPERRRQGESEDITTDRRPQDNRNREQRSHQESPPHVGHHRVHRHCAMTAVTHHLMRRSKHRLLARRRVRRVRRLGHRVADVLRHRLASAVEAALLDPIPELLDGRLVRIERHGRGLAYRVRLDGDNARTPPESG